MEGDAVIAAVARKITVIPDELALTRLLSALREQATQARIRVAFVNAHAINLCHRHPDLLVNLLDCDFVFRDGSGMKLLYRFLKMDAGLNLNGTDLIPRIFEIYKGEKVALLGTAQPYLDKASGRIAGMGLDPTIILDGFRSEDIYLRSLIAGKPSLIVLGMGMPKQERVARLIAGAVEFPCLIVCGGAILDFLGEKVTRAPLFFRRYGMEWLYRLILEPKRLMSRYTIGNFIFIFRSARFAFFNRARWRASTGVRRV